MAEILLVTGKPGDGKSLYAITRGLEFVAEGRPVYAAGFKELNYEATGFLPLPDDFAAFDRGEKDDNGRQLVKWQKLPSGAVIILDECYDFIPQRGAGKPVPPHVDALARHRHYNIDLILVTQKHDQIDGFVKGLVGTHIHVRRKWGLNRAVLKTWDCFESNPVKAVALSAPIWSYPAKNFALYKSATAHTVKRKLPWYVFALPFLLAVVIGCGIYVKRSMQAMGTGGTGAPATGTPGTAASNGGDKEDADEALRRRDYAAWLHPRVAGQPWTAPAYDKLQPQGVPDLYCIAVDDGRCECRTEQGTKYEMQAGICRTIARDGVYNPFRKPLDGRGGEYNRGRDQERSAQPLQSDIAGTQGVPATGLQRDASRSIPQTYLPPEYHPSQAEN
jgi:zona occludens toxin